jgi:ubiquinone/menaquinone biosynthesis C-methylase UbiE
MTLTPARPGDRSVVGSISFEHFADRYDATRGGLERGRALARVIGGRLVPGPVLEVGVGTGAVALPLVEQGHPVVGVDLAPAMLRHARERLGARVAVADGYRLPVAGGALANVVVVWVLQLVPDVAAFVAELARVVRPGGRLVVVPAHRRWADDEMGDIVDGVFGHLRPAQDTPEQIGAAAAAAGLRLAARAETETHHTHESPEDMARLIERRELSALWDLSDATWAAVVEPALAALRALPDPERPRTRTNRGDVLVFTPG